MINRVVIAGRLAQDLELKKTASGKSVCSFTIAVNRDKNTADFINCVAWNKTAESLTQYMKKGDMICVDGKLQTRSYDGVNGKVHVVEVVADFIEYLRQKGKEELPF